MDKEVDDGNLFLFNDEGVCKNCTRGKQPDHNRYHLYRRYEVDCYRGSHEPDGRRYLHHVQNDYLGKYKNSYDNQSLFIAAVNGYFKDLSKEEILDPNYSNLAGVDVEAQRDAWLATGKAEASEWDELTVKKNTFKRKVFLAGNVKILDAMEDLFFPITMM